MEVNNYDDQKLGQNQPNFGRNSSDVEDKTWMVKTVEGIALGYFGLTS